MSRPGPENANFRHGGCGTYLYRTWKQIKGRCLNPKNAAWEHYGARGVRLWDAWVNDFPSFRAWIVEHIGPRPPRLTLDRIDNDRGYEPGNLRWATRSTQSRNRRIARRITHPRTGETLNLVEWEARLGIDRITIKSRIDKLGWPIDKALDTPWQGRGYAR